MKGLLRLFLTSIAGVSGNLIAAYVVADVWSNVFSPVRIWGTLIAMACAIGILAMLERENLFLWNHRWHEWRYIREVLSDSRVGRWSSGFSVLEFRKKRHRPLLRTEAVRHGDHKLVPLTDALKQDVLARDGDARRVLVVGEPGSGKTTGLERTTWELAIQRRRLLLGRSRLPVLVRLDRFDGTNIEDYVAKSLEKSTKNRSGRILAHHLRELVNNGRIVLLFDALDEALAMALGEDLRRQVADLVTSTAYQRVPIIVTSRTREEPGIPETVYEIQDLSDGAVREFILRYRPKDNAEAVWDMLLKNRLLEPRGLGRNPFWLQTLLELEEESYEGTRKELIDRVVDKLLRDQLDPAQLDVRSKVGTGLERGLGREFRKSHPWKLPPNLTIDEGQRTSRRAFAWLAYRMTVRGITSLSEGEAKQEIQSWLSGSSVPLGWTPDDLLHLGQDAQILDYPYDESTRFRHRLLQETLTAWGLRNEPAIKDSWTPQIEEHADDIAWWQTLILLAETGVNMDSFLAPILRTPTAKRLTLASILTLYKHKPLSEIEEHAQTIRWQFYRSLSSGVTDDHRRAIDALQRLAGDAVIALIADMSSLVERESYILDAAIEFLGILDFKLVQPLSKNLVSQPFVERISLRHAPTLAAVLPSFGRAARDTLLLLVKIKVATATLERMAPDVSALPLEAMMPWKPARVAMILATMAPEAAGAILDHMDLKVIVLLLSSINAEAGGAILSMVAPETASKLLAKLSPEIGGAVLAILPSASVAVMLAAIAPATAGAIVAAMPARAAGPIVAAMPWEVASAILTNGIAPATAGAIVAAMPARAAGPIVAAMTPAASGLILAVMAPKAAEQILASLQLDIAWKVVTKMPLGAAGAILMQMDRRASEEILTLVTPEIAREILAMMAPKEAGMILERMKPGAARTILEEMRRTAAGAIMEGVTPEAAAAILGKLTAKAGARILSTIKPDVAGKIVERMTPKVHGAIVVEMTSEAAGHILEMMGPREAGELLATVMPGVGAAIIGTIRPEDAKAILVAMSPQSAGRILTVMMPEKAGQILNGMSPDARASIEDHMDFTLSRRLSATKNAEDGKRAEVKEDLGDGDD